MYYRYQKTDIEDHFHIVIDLFGQPEIKNKLIHLCSIYDVKMFPSAVEDFYLINFAPKELTTLIKLMGESL